MNRYLKPFFLALGIVCIAMVGAAHAGLLYSDPVSGWTYTYSGDAATAGVANAFDSLDGTWDHANGSDQWDGTGIGAGRPGGASALTVDTTGFLRLQDTGDPRDYGMTDPGSNRKLTFGHSVTNDIGSAGNTALDSGITLSFRTRLATGSPLDDLHPDGGGGISPWPAGGDGYVTHDSGKGNFSVVQSSGGIISFSLALASDDDELLGRQGLVMNNLNGTSPSADVDLLTNDGGIVNILELDPTAWHEFWITIESDTTSTGTHLVNIYRDGLLIPSSFFVTAGIGSDYADSYIAMALGSTPQSGAIDIDFFSYKEGIITPDSGAAVPEPATMLLLGTGLVGVAGFRRKFKK
jgi:hypothetical protein